MLLSCKKNIFLARFLEGFCRNSNFAPKPGHQIKIAYFPCLRTSLQTCSKERAKISERKSIAKYFQVCKDLIELQNTTDFHRSTHPRQKAHLRLKGEDKDRGKQKEKILAQRGKLKIKQKKKTREGRYPGRTRGPFQFDLVFSLIPLDMMYGGQIKQLFFGP